MAVHANIAEHNNIALRAFVLLEAGIQGTLGNTNNKNL